MAQETDAMTEAQSETIEIDDYDDQYQLRESMWPRFFISDNQLIFEKKTQDPRTAPEEIECAVAEKAINQYTLVETSGRSRSGTASSLNHHDQLLFVVRSGDEWTCFDPYNRAPAQPRRNSSGSDYEPTQVPGVSVNLVFRRQGGRGSESGYKRRYKVERDLVESFDEVWMVEYRSEQGGSRDGSYSRIKNATATKLGLSE